MKISEETNVLFCFVFFFFFWSSEEKKINIQSKSDIWHEKFQLVAWCLAKLYAIKIRLLLWEILGNLNWIRFWIPVVRKLWLKRIEIKGLKEKIEHVLVFISLTLSVLHFSGFTLQIRANQIKDKLLNGELLYLSYTDQNEESKEVLHYCNYWILIFPVVSRSQWHQSSIVISARQMYCKVKTMMHKLHIFPYSFLHCWSASLNNMRNN